MDKSLLYTTNVLCLIGQDIQSISGINSYYMYISYSLGD